MFQSFQPFNRSRKDSARELPRFGNPRNVEIERAIMPSALCPLSVRTNFDPAFHGSSDPVEHN
jgi:hypothetical protein